MKVVAILQARCGSSRLPMKSLLTLAGRPMIEHVIERVKAMAGLDEVVLATTHEQRDDALAITAHRLGILAYQGDEANVLRRVYEAAIWRRASVIVRVTADCPFFDPFIGAAVLQLYRDGIGKIDYATNDTLTSGYPDGTDTEVFSMEALRAAETNAHVSEREHVTPWIRKSRRCQTLRLDHQRWAAIKLSCDTRADYDRACEIAAKLPKRDYALTTTLRAMGIE